VQKAINAKGTRHGMMQVILK